MKKITTTIIVALSLCAFASAEIDSKKQKALNFYKIGVTALKEGDYDLAKTSFSQVLKIYPSHPQARRQLTYITANRKALDIKKRQAALHKVIIPQVNLDDASIQEALKMLAIQIKQESNKKLAPNFIIQDPTGGFNGKNITLHLSQVPSDKLLKYIADQAHGNVRYDNHAIVITSPQKGKATVNTDKNSDFVE